MPSRLVIVQWALIQTAVWWPHGSFYLGMGYKWGWALNRGCTPSLRGGGGPANLPGEGVGYFSGEIETASRPLLSRPGCTELGNPSPQNTLLDFKASDWTSRVPSSMGSVRDNYTRYPGQTFAKGPPRPGLKN